MNDLPDAPWIRDAELNGIPSYDPPPCPVCGKEAEYFYIVDGQVIGCDHCVDRIDPCELIPVEE